MFCQNCSNDKFVTVKVFRNKIRRNGRWHHADDSDTRRIICEKCGRQFYTVATMTERIAYNRERNEQITLPLE